MYIVVPYIAATLHIYLCKILSPPTLLVQPVRLHISIDHLILFISFLSLSLSLFSCCFVGFLFIFFYTSSSSFLQWTTITNRLCSNWNHQTIQVNGVQVLYPLSSRIQITGDSSSASQLDETRPVQSKTISRSFKRCAYWIWRVIELNRRSY